MNKDRTGSYSLGFLVFASALLAGTLALLELGTRWNRRWVPQAVKQSGIFCYRLAVRRMLDGEAA